MKKLLIILVLLYPLSGFTRGAGWIFEIRNYTSQPIQVREFYPDVTTPVTVPAMSGSQYGALSWSTKDNVNTNTGIARGVLIGPYLLELYNYGNFKEFGTEGDLTRISRLTWSQIPGHVDAAVYGNDLGPSKLNITYQCQTPNGLCGDGVGQVAVVSTVTFGDPNITTRNPDDTPWPAAPVN